MTKFRILYEDNHLLVVEKPVNIAVQADSSNDPDLLTMLKEDIKVRFSKPGNVYLGLVHRLDRPVGGVMVFAKTSKAASRLSDQVRTRTMGKTYQAVVCGKIRQPFGTYVDQLKKNEKTNMVSVVSAKDPQGKKAVLDYEVLAQKDNLTQVEIHLQTGRPHQIRVQFSSRNTPLWGDQRYNKTAKPGQQIALWATELTLIHPVTKEEMTFTCPVPDSYPWNSFKKGE